MLIINADDWGRNKTTTDNSLVCFKNGRITSVSAMVFMEDSQRAAALALDHGLDAGLHLNFTTKFNQNITSSKLLECQQRITTFTNKCPSSKADPARVEGSEKLFIHIRGKKHSQWKLFVIRK